jgi:hypothetical protein
MRERERERERVRTRLGSDCRTLVERGKGEEREGRREGGREK